MILVNKQDITSNIYLTIGDVMDKTVTMKLIYPYDNSEANLSLGNDTSTYPSRYNKFIVDNSLFSLLQAGLYIYEVYVPELMESGHLRLLGASNEVSELADEGDSYIVYSNDN
jgi:hypothetical protein